MIQKVHSFLFSTSTLNSSSNMNDGVSKGRSQHQLARGVVIVLRVSPSGDRQPERPQKPLQYLSILKPALVQKRKQMMKSRGGTMTAG